MGFRVQGLGIGVIRVVTIVRVPFEGILPWCSIGVYNIKGSFKGFYRGGTDPMARGFGIRCLGLGAGLGA